MKDEDILRSLQESKVQQELREHLTGVNESSQFNEQTCDEMHKKVLENYQNMTESQKEQFTNKGWMND